MSDRRVLAGTAAVTALVTVLVAGTGLGWWNSAPSAGAPSTRLTVHVSLTPRPAFFGDAVVAEIDVGADSRAVSAQSIHVLPTFDPFTQTASPVETTSQIGRELIKRFRYTIQCSSDSCVPLGKPLVVQLRPVLVTAGRLKSSAAWPATTIVSRLQKHDLSSSPHFRTPGTLPPPSYAASPSVLADALTGIAAAIALGALLLLGLELAGALARRRLRGVLRLTPLEAALAYTRDAAARPDPADRRKALGELARVLEHEGIEPLADTAGDVAWSEEPPSPDRARELADEVEAAQGKT